MPLVNCTSSISLVSYPLFASLNNFRSNHTIPCARKGGISSTPYSCLVQSTRSISDALERLMDKKRKQSPLCTVCDDLNVIEMSLPANVIKIHSDAVKNEEESYMDPDSGLLVFTRLAHINRGVCCGGGCRHCPYNHVNVDANKRAFIAKKYPSKTMDGVTASIDSNTSVSQDTEQSKNANNEVSPNKNIPRKSNVYTRTGDAGKSSLFTGERRSKSDPIFDALGTVDELNSSIGVVKEFLRVQIGASNDSENVTIAPQSIPTLRSVFDSLEHIQQLLLDVGSILATPSAGASDMALDTVSQYSPEQWVADLEHHIDAMDAVLPKQTSFILPGGGLTSSHLHMSRTVCRRAERAIVLLIEEKEDTYDWRLRAVAKFVNRLSDYLFIAARFCSTEVEVPRTRK